MGSRPSLFAPDVERYLLVDEGEQIVDEVVKHPVCMLFPTLIAVVGIAMMVTSFLLGSWWYLMVVVGLVLSFIGLWNFHVQSMDRFVITNMRVFRVHGIVERHIATMPLSRILDIAVLQPFWGMMLNYGHFTFESAAESQGLREITYVADPNRRDLTIQKVIQRAGVRAVAEAQDLDDGS
ncbi:MAG: PH domain-containing protein [Propionibacteriaceae bacterium]|jgi:uncharacterized membrane protein YdbT with pleckstrin-like domain|nr:PH domain-containing protein [Propionibacteriaceae bacterium]